MFLRGRGAVSTAKRIMRIAAVYLRVIAAAGGSASACHVVLCHVWGAVRGSMGIAEETQVRLYELVLENGRSASPFVWRIRYALAHKGLSFESMPIGFTDIPNVFGGRFKTVPVICHGDTMLAESWDIAEY